MSEHVVILGGRGNRTVMASTIKDCRADGQDVAVAGFLNDHQSGEIDGYPILGDIQNEDWKDLPEEYTFLWGIATVKVAPERHELLKDLAIPSKRFATVIHPTATVSDQAELGNGVVLMPQAVVGPDVTLGDHTQLYAQSFVSHDTDLGEMVFVANNASIGGRLDVRDGAHIGSNASLIERITVGEYAIVGLGSVVVDDVQSYEKVVGNPAESIGTID